MALTLQQKQGLHGEGFLFALASSAGLLVTRSSLDVDGVDWLIGHVGPVGVQRSPKIEVQAMMLGHAAYWVSLADETLVLANGSQGRMVPVRVPKGNILTVESLRALVRGERVGVTA